MINFKIFTIFPDLFPGPLNSSITGSALKKGLWQCSPINIRNYALDKHKTVDDEPYGHGAGMVLKPDVIANAFDKNLSKKSKIIYLSPRGKIFNQEMARNLAQEQELAILCGRYEGIDQRVLDEYEVEEISIGDYVLSGGEIACYPFIDAILRNIEGILGGDESLREESFGSSLNCKFNNLLEYPQYTRPAVWNGKKVPEILTSGHKAKIDEWRLEEAIKLTKKRRPDLLK